MQKSFGYGSQSEVLDHNDALSKWGYAWSLEQLLPRIENDAVRLTLQAIASSNKG